jgi:hypothetical protein
MFRFIAGLYGICLSIAGLTTPEMATFGVSNTVGFFLAGIRIFLLLKFSEYIVHEPGSFYFYSHRLSVRSWIVLEFYPLLSF